MESILAEFAVAASVALTCVASSGFEHPPCVRVVAAPGPLAATLHMGVAAYSAVIVELSVPIRFTSVVMTSSSCPGIENAASRCSV